jgi:ParB-like chromosome segregation protein Spo0J
MTRQDLPLATLSFDESTQVRVAIDDAVVADYADSMQAGAVFPPITVFTDGGTYYLADGYHRLRAAQRIGQLTIAAEVHDGTKRDALWCALGANRTNGQRLNDGDKTRAVVLALAAWPTKMNREIADQVGCSESLVGKVARDVAKTTGGEPVIRGRALALETKLAAVRAMVQAGHQSIEIRQALRAHPSVIAKVRRELGSSVGHSRSAATVRYEQMRELAVTGHTSRQIAAELGLSEGGCRNIIRRLRIVVPGDTVTRGLHHHDSNRIMARIVADAEDLAAGADLIDFRTLDRAQFAEWMDTLRQARTTLGTFIKRLTQEQLYGEAADSQAVQNSPSADRADAGPNGARGAAPIPTGARGQDRGGAGSQQVGLPDRQLA